MGYNDFLNPEIYENTSSFLIIKKCVYDPYEEDGKGNCMKNYQSFNNVKPGLAVENQINDILSYVVF